MGAKRLLHEEVAVPEAIVRVLEEVGIDMVFGIPGGNAMLLFDSLRDHRSTIRTVLVRHEALAGVMAEVYGRLTGKPGVCAGAGGVYADQRIARGARGARRQYPHALDGGSVGRVAVFPIMPPYQAGTGEYGNWDARASFAGGDQTDAGGPRGRPGGAEHPIGRQARPPAGNAAPVGAALSQHGPRRPGGAADRAAPVCHASISAGSLRLRRSPIHRNGCPPAARCRATRCHRRQRGAG